MQKYQLDEANRLSKEIDKLESIVKSCQNQKCERVEFTFGNGSNKSTVCSDPDIINDLREFLILRNKEKLKNLESEFHDI